MKTSLPVCSSILAFTLLFATQAHASYVQPKPDCGPQFVDEYSKNYYRQNGKHDFYLASRGVLTSKEMSYFPKHRTCLDFRHLPTTFIEPKTFSEHGQIEALDASLMGLNRLEPKTFSGLSKLKELDLSGNALAVLTNGIFDELAQLRSLGLSDIAFYDKARKVRGYSIVIEQNVFQKLTNLENLILSSNSLTSLNSDQISALPKLAHLDVSSNDIGTIAPNFFIGFPSLRSLDLCRNDFAYIGREDFNGLAKIENLRLCDNENLEQIEPATFLKTPNLKRLDLGGNRLLKIEPGQFVRLPKLERLSINGIAEIGVLRAGAFDGLRKLRVLDAYGLQIASIEPGAFRDLAKLKQLGMSNRKGTDKIAIVRGSFQGLSNLEILKLEKIGDIETGYLAFEGLDSLQKLYVPNKAIASDLENKRAYYGLKNSVQIIDWSL